MNPDKELTQLEYLEFMRADAIEMGHGMEVLQLNEEIAREKQRLAVTRAGAQ